MRTISRFEVGAVPAKPQIFQFYDEDGNPVNLNAFTEYGVEMLGSDNERVNLDGIIIRTGGEGQLVINWPRNEQVFANTGTYLLRFRFTGNESVDFSEAHEIRVTNFGRINN
jgi:hypothetical protein